MNYSFGCEPDTHDERDYRLKTVEEPVFKESVDLREDAKTGWWFGDVHNQGTLGACTSFATNDLVRYVRFKTKLTSWPTSQLFTYYATRKLRGSIDEDSGATAREALKATVEYGVTKDEIWPYDIAKFKDEPPKEAWVDAEKHQSLSYFRLEQTKEELLGCLSDGYPFTFGMKIYDSFIKHYKQVMFYEIYPHPMVTKEKYLGGHCMLAVGYYFEKELNDYVILVRNSWGKYFACEGYVHIPLNSMLTPNYCFDFWTIRTSEDERPPEPPKPEPPKPEEPKPNKPLEPIEPLPPFWKNENLLFIIGFVIVALIFVLLR